MYLQAAPNSPPGSGRLAAEAERQSASAAAMRSRYSLRIGRGCTTADHDYATEAVRALRHGFAKHLDSPAEDLDRATVVRVLDARTAAYGGVTASARDDVQQPVCRTAHADHSAIGCYRMKKPQPSGERQANRATPSAP